MRPCSPPLAFWTFLVCKCQDLGKRECWWRAPPLLLGETIFLGNYRDAVHKCPWSVEIIRCGDQDLLPFLLRICDPKGRFFHAKFPSNISHPATNQLGSPCWHSHRGFRWPYSPRSQTLLPAGLHQAEWLSWGFYATKKGYFCDLNNSLIANDGV